MPAEEILETIKSMIRRIALGTDGKAFQYVLEVCREDNPETKLALCFPIETLKKLIALLQDIQSKYHEIRDGN